MKRIFLVIIFILAVIGLAIGGTLVYSFNPHSKSFSEVYMLSENKIDGRYQYYAWAHGKAYCLESDIDLRDVLEDNEDEYGEYNLGAQKIKVQAIGIGKYKTDNSGIFMSVQTLIYEYLGQ